MRSTYRLSRFVAAFVLAAFVLGAVPPSLGAQAAPSRQDSDAFWGEYTLQPSRPGRLVTSTEPPTSSEQTAAIGSRLRGPSTPSGESPLAARLQTSAPETILGATAAEALSTFTIFANDALVGATNVDSTAAAVEPSAANNGKVVFATYNRYAAQSLDYGSTWTYIDPAQISPEFGNHQEVIYDPSHDLTFWLIMDTPFYDLDEIPPGINDNNDGNVLQLVVFVGSTDLVLLDPIVYPLDPIHNCALGTDEDYFDFPHLALTSSYLYVTANVYREPDDLYQCTTMMRFSLDEISTTSNVEYFSSDGTPLVYNFAPAHGGTDTLYFATHEDSDTLLVYDWPEEESAGAVGVTSIEHAAYLVPGDLEYTGYDCTPFGTLINPCGHDDDRVATGSLRRDTNELTFMWDAPQGTDAQGPFDWPRIRFVTLDVSTGTPATTPLEDDSIYNADYAWFLPAAAVNARGHVGGVAAFAGGALAPVLPGCAAWIYDDYSTGFLPLEAVEVTAALGMPDDDRWGDSYGARMSGLNPFQWIGSCYAVEELGINSHVVRFGRERDTYLPRKSDFDGDNKSDPVKYVPSTGFSWWRSLAGVWTGTDMGLDTTAYVKRSDFDGDGRADPAKYVDPAGAIWYKKSSTGAWDGIYVGSDGLPMTGSDFDRDGRTDLAKYVGLPEALGRGAVWYLRSSTSTWAGNFVGYDADPALPSSDYDGDGKTDFAKYVPGAGAVWYLESSTGLWQGVYIGSDGTTITGSDFDGDGITDMAKMVHSANAVWYLESSTATWVGVYLGPGTINYIQASDFDGDGKTDPAKFDTDSSGLFWLKSTTGLWDSVYMGGEPDLTVEN